MYFDASLDPFKIEFLRPDELRRRIDACPVAFVPLGTLEWHGHHNPIGLDALKAHGVCLHAAKRLGGGVVLPPCYDTGLVTPLYQKEPQHFGSLMTMHLTSRGVIEDTLVNLERTGFKVVLIYGGHYPAARLAERIAEEYATEMEVRSYMERTVEATESGGRPCRIHRDVADDGSAPRPRGPGPHPPKASREPVRRSAGGHLGERTPGGDRDRGGGARIA